MITVANRIFVAPEYTEQFEEAFRKRAGLVDSMPGFISNQVLRPVNPGDPYIVLTLWNSRSDFEAWIRSDAFTQGHAKSGSLPKEAFSAPINWKSMKSFRIPAVLVLFLNRQVSRLKCTERAA
jgi:heme-degrading monooxygenase HmoA